MKHDYTDDEIRSACKDVMSLRAFLEALPTRSAQPILADDGRSLGQVAFYAGNAVQKIKFPKQEIETWEENAEFHDMLEAAAQAVAAEVEARMIKRMEAVPAEELEKVYWDGNEAVACHTALKRVRARLIAAAKGEGQPVVVNEPPQHEGQPDLSGGSEKQDLGAMVKAAREAAIKGLTGPAWIPHDGGPCPLKDKEVEQFEFKIRGGGVSGPVYAPNGWRWSNDGTTGDIIAYRVLKWKPGFGPEAKAEPAQPTTPPGWTPAVGDVVRLKSGGPAMTVTGVDPLSLMCAWMNADNELQVEPITTLCLTPVPNP